MHSDLLVYQGRPLCTIDSCSTKADNSNMCSLLQSGGLLFSTGFYSLLPHPAVIADFLIVALCSLLRIAAMKWPRRRTWNSSFWYFYHTYVIMCSWFCEASLVCGCTKMRWLVVQCELLSCTKNSCFRAL